VPPSVTTLPRSRVLAHLQLVEEHIRLENQHDLDGIMGTFGAGARYDDEPWEAHYAGRDKVRAFYHDLLRALPDLQIEVQQRYVADDAVVLEVVIRGRHMGPWRGLPPTQRGVEFPLCAIFTFDEKDRLAGEKIYYDRGTVLRQLGMFHEPERALGRITAVFTHPLTIGQIVWRKILNAVERR
jgi:steroid delta-isomerase-like uncharacterized protein